MSRKDRARAVREASAESLVNEAALAIAGGVVLSLKAWRGMSSLEQAAWIRARQILASEVKKQPEAAEVNSEVRSELERTALRIVGA